MISFNTFWNSFPQEFGSASEKKYVGLHLQFKEGFSSTFDKHLFDFFFEITQDKNHPKFQSFKSSNLFQFQNIQVVFMEVDSINRPPPLVIVFNNRWRWCSGRFNFRLRRLELDYLRSHSCHVFYSVVVLIFFYHLGQSKLTIYCIFFGIVRLNSR